MKKTLLALTIAAVASVATTAQVVINEVGVADPSWVEITNLGGAPVDISAWQLNVYGDNVANPTTTFAFPGVAGSGTTVINPDQCIIVGESGTVPATPAGTVRFAGFGLLGWFAGVPVSAGLYDNVGNGIDVAYISNANLLQAPLALTGGAPTVWNTAGGAPTYSGTLASTTASATYRHSRIDTDSGADWTNNGTGSPGALNPFQTSLTAGSPTTPTASFAANRTCGQGPMDVRFTNTSTGTTELAAVSWDMAATSAPGTVILPDFNAAYSFVATDTVVLQLLDALGNLATSAPTTITVNNAATLVPVTAPCAVVDFENLPPSIPNPCGGLAIPDPSTSLEYRGLDPASRYRIVDRTLIQPGLAWTFPAASAAAGDTVLILDSTGLPATNEFIIHIDGASISGGTGFQISFYMMENNDEPDPQDVVALQDGLSFGTGITASNTSTGAPGIDGYKEVRLLDPNAQAINRVWGLFTFTIDNAFMTANGLSFGTDMRLIFRQRDNTTWEGNDAFAIDRIVITPLVAGVANGQPGVAGQALLDISGANVTARNINCAPVGDLGSPNGPHFASASSATGMSFRFNGEVNQPIILFAGPLAVNIANFSGLGIGQVDCGIPDPNPPFVSVIVLADGTQPNFINSLFNTGPSGEVSFTFPVSFPPGIFSTFQAAVFNSTTIIKLSNAVQLTVF